MPYKFTINLKNKAKVETRANLSPVFFAELMESLPAKMEQWEREADELSRRAEVVYKKRRITRSTLLALRHALYAVTGCETEAEEVKNAVRITLRKTKRPGRPDYVTAVTVPVDYEGVHTLPAQCGGLCQALLSFPVPVTVGDAKEHRMRALLQRAVDSASLPAAEADAKMPSWPRFTSACCHGISFLELLRAVPPVVGEQVWQPQYVAEQVKSLFLWRALENVSATYPHGEEDVFARTTPPKEIIAHYAKCAHEAGAEVLKADERQATVRKDGNVYSLEHFISFELRAGDDVFSESQWNARQMTQLKGIFYNKYLFSVFDSYTAILGSTLQDDVKLLKDYMLQREKAVAGFMKRMATRAGASWFSFIPHRNSVLVLLHLPVQDRLVTMYVKMEDICDERERLIGERLQNLAEILNNTSLAVRAMEAED